MLPFVNNSWILNSFSTAGILSSYLCCDNTHNWYQVITFFIFQSYNSGSLLKSGYHERNDALSLSGNGCIVELDLPNLLRGAAVIFQIQPPSWDTADTLLALCCFWRRCVKVSRDVCPLMLLLTLAEVTFTQQGHCCLIVCICAPVHECMRGACVCV